VRHALLDGALRHAAVAIFPILAQASNGFAKTNGEDGDGFVALLATVWKLTIVPAADFGEQQQTPSPIRRCVVPATVGYHSPKDRPAAPRTGVDRLCRSRLPRDRPRTPQKACTAPLDEVGHFCSEQLR
jgi:hypothetical protein